MPGSLKTEASSPTLRSASWRRRTEAFVVTSLAIFLCGMLIWPLGTKGFSSEGRFSVVLNSTPQGHQNFQRQLRDVLNENLGSERVQQALDRVLGSTPISSTVLQTNNIDWVRERISVGLRQENSEEYQIRLLFAGSGTSDELRLIELITTEIVTAMRQQVSGHSPGLVDSKIEHRYQQMEWLVSNMEDALKVARSQATELADPRRSPERRSDESESAFRNVGHVREIHPVAERLCQTIDGIDIANLKQLVVDMRQNYSSSTLATDTMGGAKIGFDAGAVKQVKKATTRQYPVGAVPGLLQVISFGLLALALGSVVAVNMHPFAERGFENVDKVADSLGVPVIGKLAMQQPAEDSSDSPAPASRSAGPSADEAIPWANRLTLMGGTLVFSILLTAIGFSLIDPAIREAFGQNPFHGFARIVWIFTGR